jgi:cob(I)alamin adenosyltransferase
MALSEAAEIAEETAQGEDSMDGCVKKNKKASVYTCAGDGGETDLADGPRVPKNSPRLQVCGDLDELNSWLGLVRCEPLTDDIARLLEQLQRRLFDIGGEIVTILTEHKTNVLEPHDVEALEQAIDSCESVLKPLDAFLLPGGARAAAMLHVARSVCRRAERNLVALLAAEPDAVSPSLQAYVNRLSDLLYVLARTVNHRAGVDELTC